MRAADGALWLAKISSRSRDRLSAGSPERGPLAALFGFLLVLCVLSALEVVFHGDAADFLSFYAAARAAAAHLDFYDHAALERLVTSHGWGERVYPYLYPPLLAHALRPLGMLELTTAHRVWVGVSVVVFAASVSLVLDAAQRSWRHVTPRRPPSYALLLALGAALMWALPLRNNLLLGQVNPIVLFFISLSVRAHLLDRPMLAGFWLAPAVMIKMTPAVLLLFFLSRGHHRTLLTCLAGLAVMATASLPFGAGADWLSFLRHAPERSYGASIPGLFPADTLWNFAPAGWLARLLPEYPAWVPKLSWLIFAGACAVTGWLSSRASSPAEDRLALAGFFPVVLLASPLTYLHHVVYLLPALVIWLVRAWSERQNAVFGATLLAAFIAGTDWPPLYGRLCSASASALLTSINLYAVLALLIVGWMLLNRYSVAPSTRRRTLEASSLQTARAQGD